MRFFRIDDSGHMQEPTEAGLHPQLRQLREAEHLALTAPELFYNAARSRRIRLRASCHGLQGRRSRRIAMAGRHSLLAVVLFAVILHAIAISQTILPAQDGLKFIRIAREFQTQPWADVVRGSDTHPLYPALIAVAEPLVASFAGHGPDAWRTGRADRGRYRFGRVDSADLWPHAVALRSADRLPGGRARGPACRAPPSWATTR